MLKLGINDIDNRGYHADRIYLSSSVIKLLIKDVAEYHRQYILGQKESPSNLDALNEGSLTHSLLLEPEKVDIEYAIYEGKRRQGDEWERFANMNKGKTIMLKAQVERCLKLQSAFNKNTENLKFLTGGASEFTLCVELQSVPIKVRTDYINIKQGFISDVKTTSYAGEIDSFREVFNNLNYGLSAALYLQAAEQFYQEKFDFYFIVLSKKDFTCNIYKLSDRSRQIGNRQIVEALNKYKKCKKSGIWTEEVAGKIEYNQEILEV